ncbi:hypothetical protein [Mycolicibacterium sp.]|uniref:phage terminase small subunit n=1 Tax=Mycolicibacterium sp. TaxID=2320850 RepID=UPI0037CA58B2
MAVKGRKPTEGPTRHHAQPTHDWSEVIDVPFEDAPPLPSRAPRFIRDEDGNNVAVVREWPKEALRKWTVWSRMPHCKLWRPADWEYAFDCLEVAAAFIETSAVGLATELRNREKMLGTTEDYRRDLRIKYVDSATADVPHLRVVSDDELFGDA